MTSIGNPPVLTGPISKIHAAIFSFCLGATRIPATYLH